MTWSTSTRKERLPKDWETYIVPKILKRDKYTCKIIDDGCQIQATEVDHIVRGDDHRFSNLQAVCERCHAKKSSREGNNAKARLKMLRKRPTGRHPGLR